MRLLIEPSGGIAGDMFTAALISAGARFEIIQAAMLKAASKLGSAEITLHRTPDDSTQLNIRLKSDRTHLRGSEAKDILSELFNEFDIKEKYRVFGFRAADILLKAEIKAHRDFNIVIKGDPQPAGHHHHHHHAHAHSHEEESFLHEAQDIVIDIMGAVVGLQDLDVEPEARILTPVSVGGGSVDCSHGVLPVPAPATEVILKQYDIEWRQGPVEVELATPTGVSLLAALGVKKPVSINLEAEKATAAGRSRGTKILTIPPLKICITR